MVRVVPLIGVRHCDCALTFLETVTSLRIDREPPVSLREGPSCPFVNTISGQIAVAGNAAPVNNPAVRRHVRPDIFSAGGFLYGRTQYHTLEILFKQHDWSDRSWGGS